MTLFKEYLKNLAKAFVIVGKYGFYTYLMIYYKKRMLRRCIKNDEVDAVVRKWYIKCKKYEQQLNVLESDLENKIEIMDVILLVKNKERGH